MIADAFRRASTIVNSNDSQTEKTRKLNIIRNELETTIKPFCTNQQTVLEEHEKATKAALDLLEDQTKFLECQMKLAQYRLMLGAKPSGTADDDAVFVNKLQIKRARFGNTVKQDMYCRDSIVADCVRQTKLKKKKCAEVMQDEINECRWKPHLICDATAYIKAQCFGTTEQGKVAKSDGGSTYCFAHRLIDAVNVSINDGKGVDLCGYDPAPYARVSHTIESPREKFVEVEFLCGGSEEVKRVYVPGNGLVIRMVCQYPPPKDAPNPPEFDFSKDPCKLVSAKNS